MISPDFKKHKLGRGEGRYILKKRGGRGGGWGGEVAEARRDAGRNRERQESNKRDAKVGEEGGTLTFFNSSTHRLNNLDSTSRMK